MNLKICDSAFAVLKSLLRFALHTDCGNMFPKPLSKEEEVACFEAMKKGDSDAKNKLVEHNLRLVAHIIKKYYSVSNEQDELISIGTIGLIKAVTTFDYTKGTRFATYASKCIDNEILMHFRALKKSVGDIYMEQPIETDKDGNQLTLMDTLADDVLVADKIELSLRTEKLYECIGKCLDKRECEIIVRRYGLFGRNPLTQRETAKLLGISRSYVSRIEKKALSKLKNAFGE